jgi:hypothetical protein
MDDLCKKKENHIKKKLEEMVSKYVEWICMRLMADSSKNYNQLSYSMNGTVFIDY